MSTCAIDLINEWIEGETKRLEQLTEQAIHDRNELMKTENRYLHLVLQVARESAVLHHQIDEASERGDNPVAIEHLRRQRLHVEARLQELANPKGRAALNAVYQGQIQNQAATLSLKNWNDTLLRFQNVVEPELIHCVKQVRLPTADSTTCSRNLAVCQEAAVAANEALSRLTEQVKNLERLASDEKRRAKRESVENERLREQLVELDQCQEQVATFVREQKKRLRDEETRKREEEEAEQAAIFRKSLQQKLKELRPTATLSTDQKALDFIQETIEHEAQQLQRREELKEQDREQEERQNYLIRNEIQERLNDEVIAGLPKLKDLRIETEILESLRVLVEQGVEKVVHDILQA